MPSEKQEVRFRKGPGATLPQDIVAGTLLVNIDDGTVYLDINDIQRIQLTGKRELAPGEDFSTTDSDGNRVVIDGSSVTIYNEDGNKLFSVSVNGVEMSDFIIQEFQRVLNIPKTLQDLGPIYAKVNQLPEGSAPTATVEGNTFVFGLPISSGGTASGIDDGYLWIGDTPPDPPDPPEDSWDDGYLEKDSYESTDIDDGSLTPGTDAEKDLDDGSLANGDTPVVVSYDDGQLNYLSDVHADLDDSGIYEGAISSKDVEDGDLSTTN